MAITINFPKLEKALRKDKKNVKLFYEKGIVILSGVAFAITDSLILAVDLKEFFIMEKNIESDEEMSELDMILFHLEQKVFSKEYWEELTKLSDMSIVEGKLKIENLHYTKTLDYEHEMNNFGSLLKILNDFNNYDELEDKSTEICLEVSSLISIIESWKTHLKLDTIYFKPIDKNYVKFTFKKRPYFFGFIDNKNINKDPFSYDAMKESLLRVNQLRKHYKELPDGPKQKKDESTNEQIK